MDSVESYRRDDVSALMLCGVAVSDLQELENLLEHNWFPGCTPLLYGLRREQIWVILYFDDGTPNARQRKLQGVYCELEAEYEREYGRNLAIDMWNAQHHESIHGWPKLDNTDGKLDYGKPVAKFSKIRDLWAAVASVKSKGSKYAGLDNLSPAARKAYLSFLYAEAELGKRLEDRVAWELLQEYGIQDATESDLQDYKLPAFDSWCRYLREARASLNERKYTPRSGRKRSG